MHVHCTCSCAVNSLHYCTCTTASLMTNNERIKAKTDGSKRLTYTGLNGDLEHLTIETRLIGESFGCVLGECVI